MEPRHFCVFLGEQLVGTLDEQTDGRLAFRMDEGYVSLGRRPVLSQSFEDDLRRTYWGKRPGDLPSYFSNLLPEGRFRRVVEQSLQERGDGDLGLLVALGSDLPGAVVLAQSDGHSAVLQPTAETVDDEPEREQLGFRFSLAGVQLKFSMVQLDGKLTLPAHGQGGDWIVKVGTQEFPGLAENEFSMLEWARGAGFEVPDCGLHSVSDLGLDRYAPPGSRALAIRRYDRYPERRVHQEDFMQVYGRAADPEGKQKYNGSFEELARVVLGLLGEPGYEEFVRRCALTIAVGNHDAHLKNWSLLYREPVRPVLSPVYDQVATVGWPALDRTLALKLAGARDFGRVSLDSFARLARKVEASETRTREIVGETLNALGDFWRRHQSELPLPKEHRTAIREHWDLVPLLRAIGPLA
jgi:serine/threonine-protein kinase HipA